MREGADSIELRGDGSTSNSSHSTMHGTHHLSRPQRINNNTGTATGNSSVNDGLAVFTWGRGEDGQLGLGDTADQDEPTYVSVVLSVIFLFFHRYCIADHFHFTLS